MPTNGVFEKVRVVCEISWAVLAKIRPRVGVNVCMLLKLRRGQKAFLTDITLERAIRRIRMDLLVNLQASFRLVKLQALIALKVSRFTMEILVTEKMRFFEEALFTLRAVVIAILNVVSLFVIYEIHFLKELFLTDFAAKLWLF